MVCVWVMCLVMVLRYGVLCLALIGKHLGELERVSCFSLAVYPFSCVCVLDVFQFISYLSY